MHIYQPVDLVIGVLLTTVGFIGLGMDLYRISKHTFKNRYGDWRSLGLSLWIATSGPAYLSKAFDIPHHESHLTDILYMIELVVLYTILISFGLAWIIRKRQKTEHTGTKGVHPG
jgi:hypothetical protein